MVVLPVTELLEAFAGAGVERGGSVVVRHVVHTIPPWVEYALTEKGHALNSVIDSIAAWGRRWMADRVARCEERAGAPEGGEALCPEAEC